MTTLFIHIGYPKTGTSWLQHFLSLNEEELRSGGLDYLKTGRSRDRENHAKLVRAIQSDSRDVAIETWRAVAAEVESSPAPLCVISAESFVESFTEEHIGFLSELIRDIDVKILVYLRPQAQALESRYLQALKVGFQLPDFQTYVKRQIRKGRWNYQERLSSWGCFGKENLIVRPYIRSVLPKEDILEDFRITLGVPEDLWSALPLPKERSQNLSIGPKSFAALNRIVFAPDGLHRPSKKEMEQSEGENLIDASNVSLTLNLDLGGVFRELGWNNQKHTLLTTDVEQLCIDAFAESNAFVAREYLGSDEGLLFPVESKVSSPTLIPDLTADDWSNVAVGLLHTIYNLRHEGRNIPKITKVQDVPEGDPTLSPVIEPIPLVAIGNEPLVPLNDLLRGEVTQHTEVRLGIPTYENQVMDTPTISGNQPEPTIFHVTHYKAGSQWVYAIMAAVAPKRVIKPQPGVKHVLGEPIEQGKIYPTVYLRQEVFDTLKIPGTYRRFIIIRDLRDTLISLYFSHRYSHGKTSDAITSSRDILNSLNIRDGLIWLMENRLKVSADILQSWLGTNDLLIKYEHLLEDEYGMFERIIDYCEIDVSKEKLSSAVKSASFENITHRDKGEENVHAHQRKAIAGDWRNYFDEELKVKFKKKYGELLVASEYEKDFSW